jgi:hypothetical protein
MDSVGDKNTFIFIMVKKKEEKKEPEVITVTPKEVLAKKHRLLRSLGILG